MDIVNLDRSSLVFFALITITIVLGFYFRIIGLSNGGFSNSDEYYIATSVNNILEFGVPKYPLEGYYVRGLIYQYLSAFLVLVGVKPEFALRFIPVLFSILAIPPLFNLGKKLGGKLVAGSIIFLFCFSILEIEYARLARYYIPFQTIFIWYIFFLFKVVFENSAKSYNWMLLFSLFGLFLYEGGIFLVVLNIIPFLMKRIEIRTSRLLFPIIIFIVAMLYLQFGFRNFGAVNHLPSDVNLVVTGNLLPVNLPLLFIQTFQTSIWYVIFIVPSVITLIFSYLILKGQNETRVKIIFFFLGIFSLLNLYGIIFIVFLTLYLLNIIKFENLKNKTFLYLLAICFANFIFYLIYGLSSNSWLEFFPEESSISINKIFWVFINFPNFYQKIFIPWLIPLPVLTTISCLSIGFFLIISFYKSRENENSYYQKENLLASIVIILISFVAILQTPYDDVRYTFFVYPLVLLLVLVSFKRIVENFVSNNTISKLVFSSFVVVLVFISGDYSFRHLLNIDNNEIRFRTIYEPKIENIYYYQEDYLTPAQVINKNMNDDDIIITTQAAMSYYLKKLDYEYLNYKHKEFSIRSRQSGTKEVWTNANLIYREENFFNLLRNSNSTKWLSIFSKKRSGISSTEEKVISEFSNYLYYTNIDETINVYKIPPML